MDNVKQILWVWSHELKVLFISVEYWLRNNEFLKEATNMVKALLSSALSTGLLMETVAALIPDLKTILVEPSYNQGIPQQSNNLSGTFTRILNFSSSKIRVASGFQVFSCSSGCKFGSSECHYCLNCLGLWETLNAQRSAGSQHCQSCATLCKHLGPRSSLLRQNYNAAILLHSTVAAWMSDIETEIIIESKILPIVIN